MRGNFDLCVIGDIYERENGFMSAGRLDGVEFRLARIVVLTNQDLDMG